MARRAAGLGAAAHDEEAGLVGDPAAPSPMTTAALEAALRG